MNTWQDCSLGLAGYELRGSERHVSPCAEFEGVATEFEDPGLCT